MDGVMKMEHQLDGQNKVWRGPEDADVDVVECLHSGNSKPVDLHDPDATECSSSFGGTLSDSENYSGMSEAEVESQLGMDDGLPSSFDGFDQIFQMRKKKLTNHWRNFIRPLMWRCKWAELRIRSVESQALKCAKALEKYKQNMQPGSDQLLVEDIGSKSLPFPCQYHGKKVMKRRKRNKVEENADVLSYMSHHSLFSYLENRRSDIEGTAADDVGNPVFLDKNGTGDSEFGNDNSQVYFKTRDGEIHLEELLQKIEIMHSRLHKLKSQLDRVIAENAAKFTSYENLNLLVPCEAQTSAAPSPTFSAGNGEIKSIGAVYSPNRHISEFNIGDLVLPESVVSSLREAIPVPDVIESTVGLLSAADVTLHQPLVGDAKEDIEDNVLIHNEAAADGESQVLKTSSSAEPAVKLSPSVKVEKEDSINPLTIPEMKPQFATKTVACHQQQSTLRSCLASDINFPKNKRKRGERKSGSGGWNKRCSGEPDSQ